MKSTIFFLTFAILSQENSSAQITFQKTIGNPGYDAARSVQQTADGGYIIAGSTNSSISAGFQDVYLVKTDIYGTLQWSKSFGAAGNDFAWTVKQTTDAGYIVTGWMASTSVQNDFDIYLVKTNSSGDTLWTKTLGGTGWDHGNAGFQTTDGGYFICGYIDDYFSFEKTDGNGNMLWEKIIGGGNGFAFSAQQTTDGGFIIAGETTSIGAGATDIYLVKTDGSGNIIWAKAYGGTGDEYGWAVQQTWDGGYIVAGNTNSFGAGMSDVYLIRTNAAGDTLWTRTYGGTDEDNGYAVRQTADHGFVVAGETQSFGAGNYDSYFLKADSAGNLLWSKTFGGANADNAKSVYQTNDGGYVLAGSVSSFGPDNDIYFIKTDSNGNSGCNETNPSTIVNTPVTVVTSQTVLLLSQGSSETHLSTSVNTGGGSATLCYNFPTEINEATSENIISLFPNPASSQLNLSLPKPEKVFLTIKNTLGETILVKSITEQTFSLDVKSFPAGIYFVTVTDEKKNTVTKKFVKL